MIHTHLPRQHQVTKYSPLTPGHFNSINIDSITLPVFPDSGASMCLAGTEHLKLLNIDLKELIPSSKRISVVGGYTLPCLDWLPVTFKIEKFRTKQPLFM